MPYIFFTVFLMFFLGLNFLVAYFLVNWSSTASVIHFLVMSSINIGIAYGLSELVFALIVKKQVIPKLDKLNITPKVALLYTTCDDVMPELLEDLLNQNYCNYDLFVLDDSTDDDYKNKVDEFKGKMNIIRRADNKGYKAGNLNNWLLHYGDQYDYFSVADSDSMLPPDFIENMLKYAEQPENKGIAIFQSKIRPWNTRTRFVKTMSVMFPLWLFVAEKISHKLQTLLSWGHNDLIRTKCIMEVGGYDEAYVSEDFATSLYLIEKGYKIRLVDVESYEAIPNNVQSFAKRQIRYSKQDLEILKLLHLSVPITTKMQLMINAYSYIIWFVFSVGAFLAVWGYSSNFNELINFYRFIVTGAFVNSPFFVPLLIIAFYIFYFTLLRLPLALRFKISVKDYFANLILTMATSFYIAVPMLSGLVRTLRGEKVKFDVTSKTNERIISPYQYVYETRWLLVAACLLIIGLMKNPLALAFNFPWLFPLVFTPLIVYVFTVDL